MNMRTILVASVLLLSPAAFAAPVLDDPTVNASPEQFQVTQKTEIPNTTLSPGSYSIRILDHLSDRVILQVAGKGNRVETTFIAIPASTMANAPVGPILYGGGPKGKAAIKGFAFPGGLAVEFVYPKADAVSIAQANDARVMAIDPASENRVAAPKLSAKDMEMITLWMLEPARVGPNDAKPSGIAATKYQAPAPVAPAPVQTAQAEPAPAPVTSSSSYASSGSSTPSANVSARPARRSRPTQVAQNDVPAPPPARTHTRPAGVTALPHTASALPLVWLAALVSLVMAAALRLRRLPWRG